ncbi:MAG: hypothetical protein WD942_06415 [Dehalococcoidia bacterium]
MATSFAQELYQGVKDGGASFACYLPDSRLYGTEVLLEQDPDIRTVVCAREDEGIAIAVGAGLAGELPVALMEASGVGYSGLILARARSQRGPLVVVFSHVRALGERFDYHAASRETGEGVLTGLHIPYVVVRSVDEARETVIHAMQTAEGQRTVVGIGIPGRLLGEVT